MSQTKNKYAITLEYSERGTVGHEVIHRDTLEEALEVLSSWNNAINITYNGKLLKVKEKDGEIRSARIVYQWE